MPATPTQLPLPVARYIAGFAARRGMQAVIRAGGLAMLLTQVWALAWCLLDRAVALHPIVRASALVLNVLVVLFVLVRAIRKLFRPCDWIAAAGQIERREPAFAERLHTLVSRTLGPTEHAGSPQLLAVLAQQVSAEVGDRRPGDLLPWGRTLRVWAECAASAGVAAALALAPVLDLPRLAHRYADPLAPVAPAATTRLLVSPGNMFVPQGGMLRVIARAQRLGGGVPTLHVVAPGETEIEQAMIAQPDGTFDALIQGVEESMEYFVTGGDARSETYTIKLLRRPVVTAMRATYADPTSARPPREVGVLDYVLEAPAGTAATVVIEASESLADASFTIAGETLETRATTRANVRTVGVTLRTDGRFVIRLRSAAGVESVFRNGVVRAVSDRAPIVLLRERGLPRAVGVGERVSIDYQAADDFGLARLDAEVRAADSTVRVPIPLTGDPRVQSGSVRIDLAPLRRRAGDTVEIRLRAEDLTGQTSLSAPLRLAVSREPSPPLAATSASASSSQPATQPLAQEPAPLPPFGYDAALKAYFDAIRSGGAE